MQVLRQVLRTHLLRAYSEVILERLFITRVSTAREMSFPERASAGTLPFHLRRTKCYAVGR